MENVRKHRDIKFVTTEENRNKLVSAKLPHNKTFFRKFVSDRNEKYKGKNE